MTCSYCRAQNDPDDHRCGRCGRRLNDDARPTFPVQQTAVAPKLETTEAPAPVLKAPAGPQLVRELPRTEPERRESVQGMLFGPVEVPRTMSVKSAPPLPMSPAPSARRRAARAQNNQQSLDFDATADGLRTLPTSVEARVYCDAVAAPAADRVFAAVVDTVIPLMGFLIFLAAFHFTAGGLALGPKTTPFYAVSLVLLVGFYRLICCLGNTDTPGIQCAGLRLLNFDGRRPSRRARFYRIVGGLVSFASLGIGLVWSLLDEEKLTWHDHMSATFPTRRMQ